MSKRPKDHKPYVSEVSHYEKAQEVDKSGLHIRGGHQAKPYDGRELDEQHNQEEMNRQRDMRTDD